MAWAAGFRLGRGRRARAATLAQNCGAPAAEWRGSVTGINGLIPSFQARGFEHNEESCSRTGTLTIDSQNRPHGHRAVYVGGRQIDDAKAWSSPPFITFTT